MGYRNLQQCVRDLEAAGRLLRVEEPVAPYLEMAEIQRRVYASSGPALLFTQVVDCRLPMLSNLFGDLDRARYLFRDTLDRVRRMVELKIDPLQILRRPGQYLGVPWGAWSMLPRACRRGPVLAQETTIRELPQLQSWPQDGGALITLPQVYSEDASRPALMQSNLGTSRAQLYGGQYEPDREIGALAKYL